MKCQAKTAAAAARSSTVRRCGSDTPPWPRNTGLVEFFYCVVSGCGHSGVCIPVGLRKSHRIVRSEGGGLLVPGCIADGRTHCLLSFISLLLQSFVEHAAHLLQAVSILS